MTANELKNAKYNKDENIVALCFDCIQNLSVPHILLKEKKNMRPLWVNAFLYTATKQTNRNICLTGMSGKQVTICSALFPLALHS